MQVPIVLDAAHIYSALVPMMIQNFVTIYRRRYGKPGPFRQVRLNLPIIRTATKWKL